MFIWSSPFLIMNCESEESFMLYSYLQNSIIATMHAHLAVIFILLPKRNLHAVAFSLLTVSVEPIINIK